MFTPIFSITPDIAKALMRIEAARQAVGRLPLSVPMLDSLRQSARLMSTHFSTQIEGNRLSPTQVAQVIAGGGRFPGRERDEAEVRHYYRGLEYVETEGQKPVALTEKTVRTIHGWVMTGKPTATPYRDGQNVIRDGRTGAIVYLSPEAKDVPSLMKELVAWVNQSNAGDGWPVPIIAALAHYQFATIHPYFDGNGRTARLLTTLLLHRGGYGLNGIYSLEEYYARNLAGYYDGLSVGPGHNYYDGRATADVTRFVAYFCEGMAASFEAVQSRAEAANAHGFLDQSPLLRSLDPRQRHILGLFLRMRNVAAADVAAFLSISPRNASDLCRKWVDEHFLEFANASKKARRYRLVRKYERMLTKAPTATGPAARL